MAMTTCQECDTELSDAAPTCPHCGKPNSKFRETSRSVSVLLGLGIFLLPIIFSWFTLKKGYSKKAKIISFCWLAVTLIALSADRPSTPQSRSSTSGSDASSSQATSSQNITPLVGTYMCVDNHEDMLSKLKMTGHMEIKPNGEILTRGSFQAVGVINDNSSSYEDYKINKLEAGFTRGSTLIAAEVTRTSSADEGRIGKPMRYAFFPTLEENALVNEVLDVSSTKEEGVKIGKYCVYKRVSK